MKATGIVRRIDDLGRVVIPKEIRRTLRIRVGDPLEIFTDREGEIILKKYSPIGELGAYAADYAESLAQTTGYIVCVADKDTMIAAAGTGKKECIGKAISQELEQMIQEGLKKGLRTMCFTEHMDMDYPEEPGVFEVDTRSYHEKFLQMLCTHKPFYPCPYSLPIPGFHKTFPDKIKHN